MPISGKTWVGGDFQEPSRDDGGVALCGACLESGACQLGISSESIDAEETAHFELVCPTSNEGGPGVAHGGWTSSVMSEVLGHVPLLHHHLCVTGTLTVHYVKPVPLSRRLEARAWVDRREDDKWFVSGELLLASSGALLATATAVLIERDQTTHFGGFHEWLGEQGDS